MTEPKSKDGASAKPKTTRARKKVTEPMDETKTKVEELTAEIKETAQTVSNKAQEMFKEATEEVKERVEEMKEKVGEATAPESTLGTFLHHQKAAFEAMLKAFNALIPADFKTHSGEARKEFTEAFKALIDGVNTALEKIEIKLPGAKAEAEKEAPAEGEQPSTTGKSKVKVEVK